MRFRGTQRADGVYAPFLEVEFHFEGEVQTYLALVDSGADTTMMPAESLPASVPYSSLDVVGRGKGVGGEFDIALCEVEVWFQKWKFAKQFYVVEPDKMPEPTVLLGRLDFMKRFSVWFDWSKDPGIFDVKPIERKR